MISRLGVLIAFVVASLVSPALSDAPAQSPRPDMRPASTDLAVAMALTSAMPRPGVPRRPVPRPRSVTAMAPVQPVAVAPARLVLASTRAAVRISPRPDLRPPNLRRHVVRTSGVRGQPAAPVVQGRRGAVCGDPAIQGQRLSAIPGRLKGCGVPNPVRITSIDGVALSQPATLNCTAARALKKWVSGTVKPTVGRLGGGVASLQVAAHYSCRTRNNKPGAKISEHGRGNAIDISAIVLKNGVTLTVLKGWKDRVQSRILKAVHKGACGTFGTVLGPNADRYHRDHFHLDTARSRGGAYCR